MEYLPSILAAYAILVVAATSPGPSVAMLLGIGATRGRQAALVATSGIALGSVTLNVLTLIGLGLVLQQAGWAATGIRLLGATYLAWLAYCAFRSAAHPGDIGPAVVDQRSRLGTFAMGYALQVTNPKAIVFWLAIQAAANLSDAPIAVVLGYFCGAFVISFVCHAAWAVLFSSQAFRAGYMAARRWIEASLGMFLSFMAFRLATER